MKTSLASLRVSPPLHCEYESQRFSVKAILNLPKRSSPRNSFTFPTLVAAAAVLLCPIMASAQVGPVAGWIAAGYTGKQILTEARRFVTETTNQAENTGNALMGRFANEGSVLIQTIDTATNRDLDKAIKSVDDQTRQLYMKLDEVMALAKGAEGRIYEEKDSAVVDIAQRIGDLPFASSPTFIQSIQGTAHLQGEGSYPLTVVATGLGPGAADRTTFITLFVNGKAVSPEIADASKSNRMTFQIKNEDLRQFFKPTSIAFVPARIDLTTQKNGLLHTFSRPEKISVAFQLMLFPRYAGEFKIEYVVPQYGWKFIKTIQDEWPSPDCGQGKCNVRHALKVSVPNGNVPKLGNQRIASISKACVPNWGPAACGWSYDEGTGISSDGTSASFNVRHDGEKVTWTLFGGVEEYAVLSTKTETKPISVRYGSNFAAEIPADATYYKVTGTTLTKRKIEFVKGQVDDKGQFRFLGAFDMPPGNTRIEFLCRTPTGL